MFQIWFTSTKLLWKHIYLENLLLSNQWKHYHLTQLSFYLTLFLHLLVLKHNNQYFLHWLIQILLLSHAKSLSFCFEFKDLTSFDILDKLTENLNFDEPFGVEQKHCSQWLPNGAMTMPFYHVFVMLQFLPAWITSMWWINVDTVISQIIIKDFKNFHPIILNAFRSIMPFVCFCFQPAKSARSC